MRSWEAVHLFLLSKIHIFNLLRRHINFEEITKYLPMPAMVDLGETRTQHKTDENKWLREFRLRNGQICFQVINDKNNCWSNWTLFRKFLPILVNNSWTAKCALHDNKRDKRMIIISGASFVYKQAQNFSIFILHFEVRIKNVYVCRPKVSANLSMYKRLQVKTK